MTMRVHTLLALHLVLLACPKPVEPPEPVEPPSTTAEPPPLVDAPDSCTYDDECPAGEICDGEACLRAPAAVSEADACGVPPIEFARDSARLSPNNQARLAAALACLGEAKLELVGCRDAGEAPALAEQRAASVRGMLDNLGIASDRVTIVTCETTSTRTVRLGRLP